MKKLLSLVLAVMMLLSCAAFAEGLEMSDVPNMTKPGVLPIVAETQELGVLIPQSTLVLSYDDNYLTKLVEEETGLDLVFQLLPSAETATTVDLMLAGGEEMPDVMLYSLGTKTAAYGAEGYFHILNDYYDKETGLAYRFWNEAPGMTESDYNEYFLRSTEADGNIYAFSFYTKGAGDQVRINPYLNQYWMKALNLETPTNPEEFYQVLKAFKEGDPNGNGVADEIPMIGGTWNGGDDEMVINFFTYYNPDYKLNVENDVVYAPFVTEEWQEAMIYMRKLVAEGLMSELTFSATSDELVSMVQSYGPEEQIIGCLVGHAITTIPDTANPAIYAWDVMDPFEDAFTPERTANVTKYGYITEFCETPEIAFRFFDFFCNERISLITRYGEPGVHWMYRDDDPAAFDAVFVGGIDQGAEALGYGLKHGLMPGMVNPWSGENNSIWNTHTCCLLPAATYGASGTTSTVRANTWAEGVEMQDLTAQRSYVYSKHYSWLGQLPEQVFVDPVYTQEELDKYNDTMTTVKSYVNETIASFATGQLDPVNDWETYVANCYSAGLQDWLDVAQTYWNRAHGL